MEPMTAAEVNAAVGRYICGEAVAELAAIRQKLDSLFSSIVERENEPEHAAVVAAIGQREVEPVLVEAVSVIVGAALVLNASCRVLAAGYREQVAIYRKLAADIAAAAGDI